MLEQYEQPAEKLVHADFLPLPRDLGALHLVPENGRAPAPKLRPKDVGGPVHGGGGEGVQEVGGIQCKALTCYFLHFTLGCGGRPSPLIAHG